MKALAALLAGLLFASAAYAQEEPFPLPPKEWPAPVMDRPVFPFLLVELLERRWQSGQDRNVWDLQGWVGGDYQRLWVRTEGEQEAGGRTGEAELEAFYARLIAPFWYLQAGLHYEDPPSPSRSSLAFGVQGLAPYWFEVSATAYVNDKGRPWAQLEAEYDLLFTQRLILQPRLDARYAATAERERGLGRGLTQLELGLRLRYEIRRQFAPYVGVTWLRRFGETADLARAAGEDATERAVVAGLRIWF